MCPTLKKQKQIRKINLYSYILFWIMIGMAINEAIYWLLAYKDIINITIK